MLTVHKKVVIDDNGNPMEVIIPWEEYKKIEESLGLDLTKEAIEDLNPSSTNLCAYSHQNQQLRALQANIFGTTFFP